MDDVVAMEVANSLQDLACVASEHSLVQRTKPGKDAGNRAAWDELHEDAHNVVLQTCAQVAGDIREMKETIYLKTTFVMGTSER